MTSQIRWGFTLGLLWALTMVHVPAAQAETARYNVDLDHSTVEFRVAHVVVSKTSGRFMDYSGFIEMDPEAGTVKTIETEIKTASVNTNHQKRDAHLRGPDFFNVEKYPTMIYKLKSYRKTGDDYTAVGDLTLLGVTKEVTLVGRFNGVAKDPWGNVRAGFTAEGKLNRKDFGMTWNKTLDSGGLVVGDEVYIKLDIECIKAK
ncbi:MAG: polyisoprenoid-binding protein [Nitrospirae bacterium]|nr:polyisoprenoid-binding protein [Nitrospirota bacterium]